MAKKIIAAIVMTVVAVVCLSGTVFAQEVSICNLYTSSCSSTLTVSGTTAKYISQATGYRNETTKIVITQTLQKKTSTGSWNKVSSWSETDTGYKGYATNSKSGLSKGTYRLKTVFKVYAGSNYETLTKYSSNKTI